MGTIAAGMELRIDRLARHAARMLAPHPIGIRFALGLRRLRWRRCAAMLEVALVRHSLQPWVPPACAGAGCAFALASLAMRIRGGGLALAGGATDGSLATAAESPELLNSDFSIGG